MAAYEVEFEFSMVQSVPVEAASAKEAIEKVKRGEFSADLSNSESVPGTRRKFKAYKQD